MDKVSGKVPEGYVDVQSELEALKKASGSAQAARVRESDYLRFDRENPHTAHENGLFFHLRQLQTSAKEAREDQFKFSVSALYKHVWSMTHISKVFHKELRAALKDAKLYADRDPSTKTLESEMVDHMIQMLDDTTKAEIGNHKGTGRIKGKDTLGRELTLFRLVKVAPESKSRGATPSPTRENHARAAPAPPQSRTRTKGAPAPLTQPALRKEILGYFAGTTTLALVEKIRHLDASDLNSLIRDKETGPKLEEILASAADELLIGEYKTKDEQLGAIRIAGLILNHPNFESLFLPHEVCLTGSSYFAAKILEKMDPLDDDLLAELHSEPEVTETLGLLYLESSQFAFQALPKILDQLTDRAVLGQARHAHSLRGDVFTCVKLAREFPKVAIYLGDRKPSIVSTGFAFITALEEVALSDEGDLERAQLDRLKRDCEEVVQLLKGYVDFEQGASVNSFRTIDELLRNHRVAVFTGDPGKKKLEIGEKITLLSMLLNARKGAFELRATLSLDSDLRPSTFDTEKEAKNLTNSFIQTLLFEQFASNRTRKAGLTHSLESQVRSIPPKATYKEVLRRTTQIMGVLRGRFDVQDPSIRHLRDACQKAEETANEAEFSRLKGAAKVFEKHEYSQFNRPTESLKGRWWPLEMHGDKAKRRGEIDTSPADSACSCYSALSLIYSMTPGKITTEAFPFDKVMDDAQQLYYKLAAEDPFFVLNADEDSFSGCYLRIEQVEEKVIPLGYIEVVADARVVDGKYIQGSLERGYEDETYKRVFTELEKRMPETYTAIGGLVQNGVSIYSLLVEKGPSGTTYSIIDTHGLNHGIATGVDDLDRAFKISFESIDDAAKFLQLHHPNCGGDNYAANTVTVLPVIAPKEDISEAQGGHDLLSGYAAKSAALDERRKKGRADDRAIMKKFQVLPKIASYSFGFGTLAASAYLTPPSKTPPKSAPAKPKEGGSTAPAKSKKSTKTPPPAKKATAKTLFDEMRVAESTSLHGAKEIAQKIIAEHRVNRAAKVALEAFIIACDKDGGKFKAYKAAHSDHLSSFTIAPEAKSAFAKAKKLGQSTVAPLNLMWKGYREQAMALAERSIS